MTQREHITLTVKLDLKRQCQGQVYVIIVMYNTCTSCISRINNTQIDDAQHIDVIMTMYTLIESNDNYSKISVILWQLCRD